LIPRFVNSEILFTSGKIIQGPGVADHALALLLALARRLHLILRGGSQADLPRPIELRGKTAVVVGVGGVGLLVAERAAAFGMTVLGVNAEALPLTRILERVYPPDQLNDVLPSADAVIVCAPLTRATRGMFGAEQFRRMKRSAFFINVSRGRMVDTDALAQALRRQQILGAGLDVTDPEPLPDDHPLRGIPNVIITPHIAGLSDQNRQRSVELIKTNLARFVTGLPLLNMVNKELGY
jgi:phosphoglycerate dehydrogenase-like enzyme